MELREWLGCPVSELGFSAAFCAQCGLMDFSTLEDILSVMPEELLLRPGFSMAWLGELTVFLRERGLLYLLQSMPGRTNRADPG